MTESTGIGVGVEAVAIIRSLVKPMIHGSEVILVLDHEDIVRQLHTAEDNAQLIREIILVLPTNNLLYRIPVRWESE